MHVYQANLRVASGGHYGLAQPVGIMEGKQPPPPVSGRMLHPRSAVPPPPAVASAAPTTPASGSSTKNQPHLQNLPKFQPPKFENINGMLPCPDSPGSTPRGNGEAEGEDGNPVSPSLALAQAASNTARQSDFSANLSTSAGEQQSTGVVPIATLHPSAADSEAIAREPQQEPNGWNSLSEATVVQDFKKEARSLVKEESTAPTTSSKLKRAGKDVDGAAHSSRQHHHQPGYEPHPVGSFVEYKSRSSGAWLLARVEGYDERTQTYRLDVQPHAAAERVRARQTTTDKADRLPEATPPARTVGSRRSGQEAALEANGSPTSPRKEARDLAGKRMSGGQLAPRTAEPALDVPPTADGDLASSRHVHELQRENERLRAQVSQLQAEKDELHEKCMQEIALKERYFNQLRMVHEQMQRKSARNTPR
mmetsp:Transcript_20006/g.46562  ORF Transcript_20006/g.46562 Transcript_20006/m.46562 type:complete len:423 (-) Transcript_20006:53-1321(-)|eukprot:CAMPEP_0178431310 /NCGR_PEP_ID=MMETSP0689_2-20121128/31779_1 /TAXON_ID=160604 /ORGANISM="Amphidinium massartii, Strain CS-259" /LENGTH=422 /DNA_ID=CAMNT_0020053213 /DNA_START=105 /DNA_END=1370 /DNA_ORIENTATION=-